jgi:protein-S-isoprenylcysteine O-methyltransferase Ste14
MITANLICKSILSIIYQIFIFGVLLFLPAGMWRWPRAWMFLGVHVIATTVTMFTVFPGREDLLNERFKPVIQKEQPLADKIVVLLFAVAFCGFIGFIPLDVFRFHLFPKPGILVSSLGLILFLAGWWMISVAFKENAFAAPVVKHQRERNQTVVDRGVYGIVRHPMYAGFVLLAVGMPLWLESYAAALLGAVPIAILAVRILVEERFLKRELTGYETYTKKVRYRLIPGLW